MPTVPMNSQWLGFPQFLNSWDHCDYWSHSGKPPLWQGFAYHHSEVDRASITFIQNKYSNPKESPGDGRSWFWEAWI